MTFKVGDRVVFIKKEQGSVRSYKAKGVVVHNSTTPKNLIAVRFEGQISCFPYQNPNDFCLESVYNSKLYKILS